MFWHFDQLQFWSYYTHEGVNYGGEFGLKIFSRNSTLLCDAVENLKSEWLSGVNRKHWGEQHSKYPICMVKTLSSKTFDWEIRCPDNLRFHKIGRHSCRWTNYSEIGHQSQTKPSTYSGSLDCCNHGLLASEKPNGLVI